MNVRFISTKYQYKETTMEDIQRLSIVVRPEDKAELTAVSGKDTKDSIEDSMLESVKCYSVYYDDKILAIFGIGLYSPLQKIGTPWAVFANDIDKHKVSLIKISRNWMDYLLSGVFNSLENWVDARNTRAIDYIRAIGFTVSEKPQPYGYEKLPFYFFSRGRKDV